MNEATRAGEAGKGFAVVAESIKELSKNTSNELENIKSIIESLMKDFNECNLSIKQVVDSNKSSIEDTNEVIYAFKSLDKQIEITTNKADSIKNVVSRTITDIDAISGQIKGIEKGAKYSVKASQQVNSSVQELEALMSKLDNQSKKLNEKVDCLDQKLHKFIV